jgi:hypothetical protein
LEDEGLIHATLEPQERRPSRKVFSLTPAGESAFTRWLTQPVRLPREMRLEFMLKLYFAGQEEPEVVALLIRRQQEVCARWLAAQADADASRPYVRAVRRYRRGHIEAIRDWLVWLSAEWTPIEVTNSRLSLKASG